MKTFLFIVLSSSLIAQAKAASNSACKTCENVEKIKVVYGDDHGKGYEEFNKFMAQVKLSTNKTIREKELESLLTATVLIIKSDDRQELADYLVDMKKHYPKEFSAALAKLSDTEREDIDERLKIADDLMKNGEEP